MRISNNLLNQVSKNAISLMACYQHLTNQPEYIPPLKHVNFSVDSVNINDLKFRPIIDQTGTMTYSAANIISDYLKPLCKNKYAINDTLSLVDMIKRLPPLPDDQ